jgi:hypothetical protein
MVKSKFTLTSDLVKVEPEPDLLKPISPQPVISKVAIAKEAINVNISKDLKKRFQMWCLLKGKSMTESIEEALEELIA